MVGEVKLSRTKTQVSTKVLKSGCRNSSASSAKWSSAASEQHALQTPLLQAYTHPPQNVLSHELLTEKPARHSEQTRATSETSPGEMPLSCQWNNKHFNIKRSCLWACNSRTPNLHTPTPHIALKTTVKLFCCSGAMEGRSWAGGAPQPGAEPLWNAELSTSALAAGSQGPLRARCCFGDGLGRWCYDPSFSLWLFAAADSVPALQIPWPLRTPWQKILQGLFSCLPFSWHDLFLGLKSVWNMLPMVNLTSLWLSSRIQYIHCMLQYYC